MSSSRNFLLRYDPDYTFSSRKMKKLPSVGGGTPSPARSLSSHGLGRLAPPQKLSPQMFWVYYATVRVGSKNLWSRVCTAV